VEYAIEIPSCDMMHLPSFMKIGIGVQATLRCCLRNLNGCNVSTTDGEEL
jgi:uncharacterized protein YraI